MREAFDSEVDYLWSRLALASRHHGALASLWSRNGDPRIARLIEWAGYMFGRVKEKTEDDVPEVANAIVAGAFPEILRPVPCATIVQFQAAPSSRRTTGYDGAALEGRGQDGVPCTFQACWPVRVSPVVMVRADVKKEGAGFERLVMALAPSPGVSIAEAVPDPLRVFVRTPEPLHALDVVHALHSATGGIHATVYDERGNAIDRRLLGDARVRWTALDAAVSPPGAHIDRFRSGPLLRTLSTLPEAFGFFDVVGLTPLRWVPKDARRIELSLPLARPLPNAPKEAQFVLHAAPAMNVFATRADALRVRGLGPCGSLRIPDRPGAEVFQIDDARFVPDSTPDLARRIHLWDVPQSRSGHACDDIFLVVERRPTGPGDAADVRAYLRGFANAGLPAGRLEVDLLATDGRRPETLASADLALRNAIGACTIVSRMTAARSVSLSERLAWRLNAFARMPLVRFARKSSLAAFLEIHQPSPGRGAFGGGLLSAEHQTSHRVIGKDVQHGDEIMLTIADGALGGPGAAWLVGEILARAVAERADFLRYSRVKTVSSNTPLTDYGVRVGERLPPPFG